MREEVADLVFQVIDRGLQLKDRVQKDPYSLDLDNEQSELRNLLLAPVAARWSDYGGGEASSADSSLSASSVRVDVARRDGFMGIRYALTCWLDEIMTDSPWGEFWREKTLEVAIYGGARERAWKFWKQFDRAENRPGRDALEVYFLCAMLGFRGDLREKPDELRRRLSAIQPQIAQSQGRELDVPHGQDPETRVPPRRARERFHRVMLACAAVWFGIVFLACCLLVRGR